MTAPSQVIFPGMLEAGYRRQMESFEANRFLERMWARDLSLWPCEEHAREHVQSNLNWLDLPDKIEAYADRVAKAAEEAEAAGFEDWVFVGMGGANLAAETVSRLAKFKRGNRFFLLDSTAPETIRRVEKQLSFPHTFFVFANKLGKNIETHALFLYFLDKLKASGVMSPGRHFAAVTEENSYLAAVAGEYQFTKLFFDPPGIVGRFSATIHFPLLMASLFGFDSAELARRVKAMRDACLASAPREKNPAFHLGALLVAAALGGKDKLAVLTSDELLPMRYRIGHLVGASTGKGGQGIVPICGELPLTTEGPQCGIVVAMMRMNEDGKPKLDEAISQLQRDAVPTAIIELQEAENLPAELFKWEIATTLVCASLGTDAFKGPDIRGSKNIAMNILDVLTATGEFPAMTARVRERGIELYAEGVTRQEISTFDLSEALRSLFELRTRNGYVAILNFLDRNAEAEAAILRVRGQLASRLGVATTVVHGPRYLHGVGQAFKDGPSQAIFLVLTAAPAEDMPVPGAGYSFGQLQMALALGDFESLYRSKKIAVRLHFAEGAENGLLQLEKILDSALAKVRRTAS